MNTGHDGSLSTIHANAPRDALARVETMVLMAGYDLPVRAIRQQVASALELIVHLERMSDGTRRVTAITEVLRMEGDVITTQDLFRFELGEITREGAVVGALRWTGLRPGFVPRLDRRGIAVPTSMKGPGAEVTGLAARLGDR
jgi:pilus assembly protein CpaF